MPTYEYQCDACRHRFEAFQSIKADPIKRCPECRKMKVKRLISAGGGLIFKGSGFYITDYRDKGYSDKAKADTAPAAAADGKSDAKAETQSDSKPETKPDTKSETKPHAKPESKPETKADSKPAPPPAEPKSGRSDSAKSKKK